LGAFFDNTFVTARGCRAARRGAGEIGHAARNGLLCLILLVAGACASAPPATDPSGPTIAVGVAVIDITPDEPIRLTGYGNRVAPASEIRQRLWAKALAVGAGDAGPSILLTTDLIGLPRAVTEEVGRRLKSARIEQAQLALTSTHTHTGPSLAGVLPFILSTPVTPDQQEVIERYTKNLVDKLERVARAALADRRPARLEWTRGTARFAANRRVLKDGKWTAFGINPDGPVDFDFPMLVIRDTDYSPRAVLVSYACHATTLSGSDNFVHGDWPGAAQALIQQRHPRVIAMVTAATGADSNPNPRGNGLVDVDSHGEEVANEVDRLLASGKFQQLAAAPIGRLRWLTLQLAALPTRVQWEEQAKATGSTGLFARAMLDRLNRGEQLPSTVEYPVQTWTFGERLAMVFLGGEVVADYGLRLKKELDGARLWVNAYSNDVSFYVASRRLIPEGGYEVDGSMVYYGHPGRLADGTEDQIVSAVRELLPGFAR
jgi:Neutral/alkaline non-lysosomal ceramidase, N-terminal